MYSRVFSHAEPTLSDYSKPEMEKDTPVSPKFGEMSEARKIAPHVLQAGSIGELLQKRLGPKNQQAVEGSLSLEQWETQWQQYLRTLENPPSGWGMPPLPEKPSPWEDAKAFLASFEQVAEACQWPKEEWTTRILPALSGEANWAFYSLDVPDRKDYGKVKAAILRGDALSREKQRQQFRGFCYQEAEGPRGAYSQLREMCRGWLRVENHSKEQILEFLILEQLLSILPPEIQSCVRESGPENCFQVVALAEEFLLSQEKQVPSEDAARSISKAAKSTDKMTKELQGSSSENAKEEDAEGNLRDPGGNKRKEGADTDEKSDEHIPIQGGGLHEISVQEGSPTKDLGSNHCREKEKESLSVGKTSIQKSNILFQEQIHSGEKPYNCLECGKCFSRQTALTSHRRFHSEDDNEEDKEPHGLPLDKAKSQKLKGDFRDQFGPQRPGGSRLAEKRDQPYLCQGGDFCEVILTEKEMYKCLECGKVFSDQAQYKTHLQKHSRKKNPKCLECGKSFRCRSELLRHQRICTTGKANIWSPGSKSLSCKANLVQHQRIHSEEKPFTHSGTGRSFSGGKKGNAHFPKHNRKKACICFQCGKKFNQNYYLQRHQRTHTGEKPFECSGCGKKFSQTYHLQRHQRIHTAKKLLNARNTGTDSVEVSVLNGI